MIAAAGAQGWFPNFRDATPDNVAYARACGLKVGAWTVNRRDPGGSFHNQAEKGAESALSCMMARTAAYTGREVTWEETLKSTEKWDSKIDLNKLG